MLPPRGDPPPNPACLARPRVAKHVWDGERGIEPLEVPKHDRWNLTPTPGPPCSSGCPITAPWSFRGVHEPPQNRRALALAPFSIHPNCTWVCLLLERRGLLRAEAQLSAERSPRSPRGHLRQSRRVERHRRGEPDVLEPAHLPLWCVCLSVRRLGFSDLLGNEPHFSWLHRLHRFNIFIFACSGLLRTEPRSLDVSA